jgi:HD superfamily phosphohydrolase
LDTKRYEIRCPIHGFIKLEPWEWEIIHHPAFQRLRRIRQLGWTDMLYPGAMHTRFEHSLGVMQTATRMFNEIWYRQGDVLKHHGFGEGSKIAHRTILRLATLLHDVGHSPFSHAGEGVMPINPATGDRYKHEAYSSAIIRELMTDVIDDYPPNQKDLNITAAQIADFLEAKRTIGQGLMFWRQLADSQLDADRADYLLRDSLHIGVRYGMYDLDRLIVSLVVGLDETENPVLAVNDGGWHAAESLVIARYMMFTQVYFHRTRRIYDFHLGEVLKSLLADAQAGAELFEKQQFPTPVGKENLREYLEWDDWRVLGLLSAGKGGEHGNLLRKRDHYRMLCETRDLATEADVANFETLGASLEGIHSHLDDKVKNDWYKANPGQEIRVTLGPDYELEKKTEPLSVRSMIVKQLQSAAMAQVRLYVAASDKQKAIGIKDQFFAALPQKKGAA